jgi:uncharacterized protein with von Willebrand factor type A (vWA) domain
MPATIPLEGLYFHLLRAGFPLSVRDYQDAVLALRRGYGTPRREDLRWLCETLWARTEQEVSRLDRLFRELPWPSDEELHDRTSPPAAAAARRKRRRTPGAYAATEAVPETPAPILEFAARSESGMGLPAAVAPDGRKEVFILSARPLVSVRSLIVAWRRFRLAQRSGPRVELDLDATVAAQTRDRFLLEPVLLPARRNQARLVVLIDASESMAPWRSVNRLIAESLDRSQLAHTALHYFDEAPDDDVYEDERLSRVVPVERALQRHDDCALLIVSDAGAARGRVDRARVRQFRNFIARVKGRWQPIVWLNPMPRQRWRGTVAESMSRVPGLLMLPFTDDSLIHAVDYLRGKRD